MPTSNLTRLQKLILEQAKSRMSPFGIKEYLLGEDEAKLFDPNLSDQEEIGTALTFGTQGAKTNPFTVYREKYAGSPPVFQHERFHAGQLQLPKNIDTENLIPIWGIDAVKKSIVKKEDTPYEIPAYAVGNYNPPSPQSIRRDYSNSPRTMQILLDSISNLRKTKQQQINQYLDEMYKLNPGQTAPMEVTIQPELLRDYIRYHPRPFIPPINPLQNDLPQLQSPNPLTDILRNIDEY